MYKQIIGSMLLLFALSGCRKQNDLSYAVTEAETVLQFSIDGADLTQEIADPEKNVCSGFLFGGSAGYYFGRTTGFQVNANSAVDITFGTGRTPHAAVSQVEFEKLIAPGTRTYGSLGAFNSYPGLKSGCVEISFIDKHNTRWASTHIQEKQTSYGIDAAVTVKQPGGEFIIESIELQQRAPLRYLVKGHFKCLLFEVNGEKQKKIKGQFRAFVDNIN
ncbi:MAG TPA: hypothetical protein VK618_02760 [Flavitalea sp.]|nr:hypothetical protein [Flavitalea sp.]